MNSLSWMIYWADVCGNVGFPAGVFFLAGTIAAFISTCVKRGCEASKEPDDQAAARISASIQRASIPIAILSLVLAVFVPGKNTIYAIAASELGEQALKSPTVTKAQQALDAWLDKQIEKPEKK